MSVIVHVAASPATHVFHHKDTVPSEEKSPECNLAHPAIGPAATVVVVVDTVHINMTSPATAPLGLLTTGLAVAVVKSVSNLSRKATAIVSS